MFHVDLPIDTQVTSELSLIITVRLIGGFKGEAGEALPPQIFLTLKFVVCIALKIIEIVAT